MKGHWALCMKKRRFRKYMTVVFHCLQVCCVWCLHRDFQLTLKWSTRICRLLNTFIAVELYPKKPFRCFYNSSVVKSNIYEIKFKFMKSLGIFREKPWHKCQEINMYIYVYVLVKSETIIKLVFIFSFIQESQNTLWINELNCFQYMNKCKSQRVK